MSTSNKEDRTFHHLNLDKNGVGAFNIVTNLILRFLVFNDTVVFGGLFGHLFIFFGVFLGLYRGVSRGFLWRHISVCKVLFE